RRIGSVNRLAAVAAAPIDINLKVFVVNLQVIGFINFGNDLDFGETSLTQIIGVKRAQPDQPVNAVFALKFAVYEAAFNLYRTALETGFITGRFVDNRYFPTIFFKIARIHSE